jgi:hypothetical protein
MPPCLKTAILLSKFMAICWAKIDSKHIEQKDRKHHSYQFKTLAMYIT